MAAAEPTRRDFLYIATAAVGAVGTAAVAWPLIAQMNPDASTIAAGAPIEVDLAPVAEGQIIKVFWRGKPIFVRNRTKKEIEEARAVDWHSLPDPQPLGNQGDYGGWFCPCHGSQFDTSARIRRGPAPSNLPLPPYDFVSDTKIKIG